MSLFPDLPLILRIALATLLSYAYVIVLVRIAGKRTVASLTTFDWIVNVAVGSLVASAMVDPDKWLEKITAITTVVVLQFFISKATVYSRAVSKVVTDEPSLLVRDGKLLPKAMKHARVNEDEIASAMRKAGISSLVDVGAVVMESGGCLSVIDASISHASSDAFALRELHGKNLRRTVG